MKCKNPSCKKELPGNASFCYYCGQKVDNFQTCSNPKCGKDIIPKEALFCPECGIGLKSATFSRVPSNKFVAMVKVEGGSFSMGGENHADEKPIHAVNLDTFYIGVNPVTQKEWETITGDNPSFFKGADRPVEQVSWMDAIDFCNALSKREGYDVCYKINGSVVTLIENAIGYRLPTEAEWEYAARGGNKSKGFKYAGNDFLKTVGWYEDISDKQTHVLKQKAANELGLYDMSGNVWEWCWDWKNNYGGSPSKNPTGPGTGSNRVYRGGAYCSPAKCCVTTFRHAKEPYFKCFSVGFRMVFACGSK